MHNISLAALSYNYLSLYMSPCLRMGILNCPSVSSTYLGAWQKAGTQCFIQEMTMFIVRPTSSITHQVQFSFFKDFLNKIYKIKGQELIINNLPKKLSL